MNGQIKMTSHQSNSAGTESATLSVSGMTCSGCSDTVKRVLSRVPGVTDVKVDLDNGAATVGGSADGPTLVAAVIAAGYDAQLR